jgi:hypothetical protein
MKKYAMAAIVSAFLALSLTGCGGGGGGGGSAPATTATTKVFLFGTMSSNSRIAGVTTSLIVPSSVLVNYTSPAGASTGTWPLRSGVIVASGPIKVDTVSGSYDIITRKLAISLINGGFLNLSSSTTKNSGKGTEIATLNFKLAKPGVTTPAMPTEDASPTVKHDRPGLGIFGDVLNGCKTNFSTLYQ